MKKIYKDKILNINWTDLFDNKFLFTYLNTDYKNKDIEVFFMRDLLKQKENISLLNNIWDKYAMYSNVYSEKDELEIFNNLFEYAITNNKKIHIVWITLEEELLVLEKYYEKLWYLRTDVGCFIVDFKKVLVTVWVNIENLIWKWSDYKKMKEQIYFIPPVREAWLTKAMYKWINRWSISSINITNFDDNIIDFFKNCLSNEHILPLTLSKNLHYNLLEIGFSWKENTFEFQY